MRNAEGGIKECSMRIGLIDVDGHHFPNLALMRISAWHKAQGDTVEWWWSDFIHYDIVYMSKIFSDAYSPDKPEPMNADKVIKGGTGYCISLGPDGKEHFDQSKNHSLPPLWKKCSQITVSIRNSVLPYRLRLADVRAGAHSVMWQRKKEGAAGK